MVGLALVDGAIFECPLSLVSRELINLILALSGLLVIDIVRPSVLLLDTANKLVEGGVLQFFLYWIPQN